MTTNQGTGIALVVVGAVLALWSLTGAAQNIMWALNHAYRREETRGFLRRRITALVIVVVTFFAFALVLILLVLGPYVSDWIGDAVGEPDAVHTAWWTAQWPILAAGLLVAFATVLHFGPAPPRPRFRIVTIGATTTLVIWVAGVGGFLLLREPLRFVQQGLGLAVDGRHHADLAVAVERRAALRRGDQRGDRARPTSRLKLRLAHQRWESTECG